jgi:cysteine desulfuration protein SufE
LKIEGAINMMSPSESPIPARLSEIIEDFQWAEGREKIEMLVDFSEKMPPLPEWLQEEHDSMESVPECMTPVFVKAETIDSRMTFYFDVPPESPTVRGFAAILADGLQDTKPEEVLAVPNDFYHQMGLDGVLTMQRLNGFDAILAHMKRLAAEALQK